MQRQQYKTTENNKKQQKNNSTKFKLTEVVSSNLLLFLLSSICIDFKSPFRTNWWIQTDILQSSTTALYNLYYVWFLFSEYKATIKKKRRYILDILYFITTTQGTCTLYKLEQHPQSTSSTQRCPRINNTQK